MSDIGVRTGKSFLNEDQRWIHGSSLANGDVRGARTVTLDMARFSRVTFADGYIPSGVVLAKVTATGLYAPYADATEVAQPGTGIAVGHLLASVEWKVGADTAKVVAALVDRLVVVEAFLPTGHGLDANGKADIGNKVTYV